MKEFKEYLVQCIKEWLDAAGEREVRIAYAYVKRLLHK
jgi:hypothetical protein